MKCEIIVQIEVLKEDKAGALFLTRRSERRYADPGTFQNLGNSFDAAKGNLTYRKDNKVNIQENFTYDNLNRLTGFAGKTVGYDTKGNLTSKSDVGTFSYKIEDRFAAHSTIYLGGDYYTAPAIYMKNASGSWALYNLCRDHLGSLTHGLSSGGALIQEQSYDAWGRFLSPGPYVQAPDFTLSLNRHSYCLNNPLRYTDPNGEFIWTIINGVKDFLRNTFVNVWSQGFNAWSNGDNWHSTKMAWKIEMGLFKGDFKQIVSRFTWELPQTLLGYTVSGVHNTFDGVKSVTYYGGATAVESYSENWGGFTLGSYINGHRGLQADPNNSLFQHEYGHYLQSQSSGLFYLQRYALPSLIDAMGDSNHKYHAVEQDANIRAYKYFMNNVDGFNATADGINYPNGQWHSDSNPIKGYNWCLDYNDAAIN